MPYDLVRRCLVATSTAVLTASVLLVAPAMSPTAVGGLGTASADDCPAIEVIFARGTDDTPGVGRVGGAFIDSLRGKVGGRSVRAYAVNYRATYDFFAAADGANDASGRVQYMMGACPDTRLVLGGYSQGAGVIDVIAAVPFPAVGFNNPLPPDAPDHVAAIAVFGNPTAKVGLPITSSPVWGGRSIDLCNGGDPVCESGGSSIAAHSAYPGGDTNQAASFVAGLL